MKLRYVTILVLTMAILVGCDSRPVNPDEPVIVRDEVALEYSTSEVSTESVTVASLEDIEIDPDMVVGTIEEEEQVTQQDTDYEAILKEATDVMKIFETSPNFTINGVGDVNFTLYCCKDFAYKENEWGGTELHANGEVFYTDKDGVTQYLIDTGSSLYDEIYLSGWPDSMLYESGMLITSAETVDSKHIITAVTGDSGISRKYTIDVATGTLESLEFILGEQTYLTYHIIRFDNRFGDVKNIVDSYLNNSKDTYKVTIHYSDSKLVPLEINVIKGMIPEFVARDGYSMTVYTDKDYSTPFNPTEFDCKSDLNIYMLEDNENE